MICIVKVFRFLLLAYVGLLTISCGSPKELQYLQGTFDTTLLSKISLPETIIQKGDLLIISVFSDNASSSKPFNQEVQQQSSQNVTSGEIAITANPISSPSYLVDVSGNIAFPVIGTLKVEGLTKLQLTQLLNDNLKKYLFNPYYNIRFVNFKITVIGEVAKPGLYSVPNERINVLEAIGLAGDLTFFGKRDNVLIIRESNGKREFGRLDLRSPGLFRSPYYYLHQNDIVLIDMSKRKVAANDQVAFRNISLAATIVSAIAVLVSVLRR